MEAVGLHPVKAKATTADIPMVANVAPILITFTARISPPVYALRRATGEGVKHREKTAET
jgi:hypothetical protein